VRKEVIPWKCQGWNGWMRCRIPIVLCINNGIL
jgi:hypothetical protein